MGKQLAITSGGTHLIGKKLYLTDDSLVYRKAKKAYLTVPNFTKRDLPDGYTQVEYIESSGTQYIDTGFNPTYQSRVVLDISGLGSATAFVFGVRDTNASTASNQFTVYRKSATEVRSDYFGTNASVSISDTSARTTIDKDANIVSLFGETITNTAVSSGACSYPLYLFTINNVGAAHSLYASYRLYSCQIYDNGTLVRDYVPCTNASGAAGLYDLANDTFYQNAGSGTFTAGDTYMLIHRLCFSGGVDVAALGITYTGNMTDAGVVTMSDGDYRLLTLTSSGTLTVDEEVSAEVWMCGGGTSGNLSGGGAGAFTASGELTLTGSMVATVAAGGTPTSTNCASKTGASSFGGLTTPNSFTINTSWSYGVSGGTGGGGAYANGTTATGGSGDGVAKYPFGDSSYFKCHCAGGGGGMVYVYTGAFINYNYVGGDGGTNGGSGGSAYQGGNTVVASGGNYGGGVGGVASGTGGYGQAATFYGSGGGGRGSGANANNITTSVPGAGYQGVIYIRIPVEQAS